MLDRVVDRHLVVRRAYVAHMTLAGAPEGRALRGPNLTLVFLAEASDGNRVAYALAEVD